MAPANSETNQGEQYEYEACSGAYPIPVRFQDHPLDERKDKGEELGVRVRAVRIPMPRGSRIALLWVVAYLVHHGLLELHDKSPMQMLSTNPKRELCTLTASAVTLSAAGHRPGARLDLGFTRGRSGNAYTQSPGKVIG